MRNTLIAACALMALLAGAHHAAADSFAGLNIFGFPSVGGGTTGLSDITSNAGTLSASSASFSPSGQFTGYFGSGLNGMWLGTGSLYPTATHDASTVAYSRNVAFESILGDDSIAFPDTTFDTGTTWSGLPSIKSSNGDIKYAESVQLMLSTESDTMPMTTGFSFPGFFGNW